MFHSTAPLKSVCFAAILTLNRTTMKKYFVRSLILVFFFIKKISVVKDQRSLICLKKILKSSLFVIEYLFL